MIKQIYRDKYNNRYVVDSSIRDYNDNFDVEVNEDQSVVLMYTDKCIIKFIRHPYSDLPLSTITDKMIDIYYELYGDVYLI